MRMLRCFALVLCALLAAIPAFAKEKISKQSFDFSGHPRVMYVVIPDKPGPLPVVVLLHGSGRNGEIMAQAWKDLAAREAFIIAAPDAYDSAGWGSLVDPPEFFKAVIDQVKTTHPSMKAASISLATLPARHTHSSWP